MDAAAVAEAIKAAVDAATAAAAKQAAAASVSAAASTVPAGLRGRNGRVVGGGPASAASSDVSDIDGDDDHSNAAKDAQIQRLTVDMGRLRAAAERAAVEAGVKHGAASARIAELEASLADATTANDDRIRCGMQWA